MADISENFYDNRDEAEIRLRNSIVEYEGRPVWVDAVTDGYDDNLCRIHIAELPLVTTPDGRRLVTQRKIINSPGFKSFRPIRTGWFNPYAWCSANRFPLHASYLSRHGARRRRQGLNEENAFRTNVNPDRIPILHRMGDIIKDAGFAEAMRGDFPSLDEALERLTPNSSMAIALDWCVHRDEQGFTWLYYLTDEVGMFFRGSLYVFENFAYLRETIQSTSCLPNHFEIGV